MHPERGGITFIIEQDDNDTWYCEKMPPFVDPGLVAWTGTIEYANESEDSEAR